jgi:chromosome segregation ATPase
MSDSHDAREKAHARAISKIREVKLAIGEDNSNYPKLDDVENHLFQSNVVEDFASKTIQLIQIQNRQLKAEVSAIPPLKNLNHQLLTKLHQQSTENSTLKCQIATQNGEIATLKGQIATLNAQNENFSCEITTLTAANSDLNVNLSSIQRRFRIGQYLIAIHDAQTFLMSIGCEESKNRLAELRQSYDWINYERVPFSHYIVTDEGLGKKMYKVKVLLDKLGAMNDDEKVELNGMLGGENILPSVTRLLSEIYFSEFTLPEDCSTPWWV